MTADITIQSTPGQAAAVERDGFLVVAGPTEKPCPECGGSGVELWVHPSMGAPPRETTCPTCNGDGTVQTVVEVVVPAGPHGPCHWCGISADGCRAMRAEDEPRACCPDCWHRIPARTLLRGTAEAVPVVDDVAKILAREGAWPRLIAVGASVALFPSWDSEGGFVTHHFADVPRPEVGDTAWIIRGEGS